MRYSFWFVPSLIIMASIVLAIALIEVDSASGDLWLIQWSRQLGAGAEGSREIMSTIAGSMMSVVGVTFSMILVVLSLVSSQYTSRILRNFMRNRATQVALGIFVGIFTYCLIVMRTIRGGDEGTFIPNLSVFFGFVLALLGIGTLMFFIHHIASSIQASNIVASVADETILAIERLFPQHLGQTPDEDADQQTPELLKGRSWKVFLARKNGYIQKVNNESLLRIALDQKTIVRMERGIGEFVVQGTPLVSIAVQDTLEEETINALLASFTLSNHRTVEQDLSFGIKQIVDVALKALSPSIVDTTTAVLCVDYLSAILSQIATRKMPSALRYEEGQLRVIAQGPSFERLLAEAFNQIRSIAKGDVVIIARMIDAFETLAGFTSSPQRRKSLLTQVQWTAEMAGRTVEAAHESEKINARLLQIYNLLEAEPVLWAEQDNQSVY